MISQNPGEHGERETRKGGEGQRGKIGKIRKNPDTGKVRVFCFALYDSLDFVLIGFVLEEDESLFTGFPQGKSRLGRGKLTSASCSASGDNLALLFVLLPVMLCYAMLYCKKNNSVLFCKKLKLVKLCDNNFWD